MDSKNVIAAISLSAAVIILYSLFFAPPPIEINNTKTKTENLKNNTEVSSPSIDHEQKNNGLSRKEVLRQEKRIEIENKNIVGSISLKGSVIDDITFKNYTTKLDTEEKVILLSPNESKNGYQII